MSVAEGGQQHAAREVHDLGVRGDRVVGRGDDAVDDDQPIGVGADAVDPDRATVEHHDRHGNLLETTLERNIQRRF